MSEGRMAGVSLMTVLGALAIGAVSLVHSQGGMWGIGLGALAIAFAYSVAVPVPSGEPLSFGLAVVVAIPLLAADGATAVSIYAIGLVTSWIFSSLGRASGGTEGSHLAADAIAVGAYSIIFYAIEGAFRLQFIDGEAPSLVAAGGAGLIWYVVRAAMRALVGPGGDGLSVRYLWLLALEDWAVILSLLTAGALFGFAWADMGVWAIPVAILPYAFSHLAFVRYAGTRRTYRQTIKALAQIPEVAGLAPAGHSGRTASLALAMAQELGMHPREVIDLEYAALMHDIGRITLNEPAILRAGYTDEDIAHWGAQIIGEAHHLKGVAKLVDNQHQPYRKPGEARDSSVMLGSQLIKVASAFDEAVHERELVPIDALELVYLGAAYDFDPFVIGSLRRVLAQRGMVPT